MTTNYDVNFTTGAVRERMGPWWSPDNASEHRNHVTDAHIDLAIESVFNHDDDRLLAFSKAAYAVFEAIAEQAVDLARAEWEQIAQWDVTVHYVFPLDVPGQGTTDVVGWSKARVRTDDADTAVLLAAKQCGRHLDEVTGFEATRVQP